MSRIQATSSPHPLRQRSLLFCGISTVSVLAVLGSTAVWAQDGLSPATDSASPTDAVPEAPALPASEPFPSIEVVPALPGNSTPTAPIAPMPGVSSVEPSPDTGESFIDTTKYSIGATQRSVDQPVLSRRLPNLPTAVSVGPVAVGNYGVTFGGNAGTTTPSVRDYYYRTLRPPGMLGNGNIRLIFPLSIPAPITSLFGWRIHPVTGEQRFHMGTDIGAPIGTPVLAAYAGQVAIADFLGGYGLAVALEHNKGTQQTLYGHLSEIFVKPGEWVKQGSVIGRVGNTGLSTGPHLHFEFHQKTSEGWVALDAGAQLEYALAQFAKTMGMAQIPTDPDAVQTLQLDLSATVNVSLQDQS